LSQSSCRPLVKGPEGYGYGATLAEEQLRKLDYILQELGLSTQGLGNAGNDAAYTLHAAATLVGGFVRAEDHAAGGAEVANLTVNDGQTPSMQHMGD